MKKLIATFLLLLVMLASVAPEASITEAKSNFTNVNFCSDLEPKEYPYS